LLGGDSVAAVRGKVSSTSVVLRENPAALLIKSNAPATLHVQLDGDPRGTRIIGRIEPPGWLAAVYAVWFLVAAAIGLTMMVAAVQALFPYGNTSVRWDWPSLAGPPLFLVAGLVVMCMIQWHHEGEARRLSEFLVRELEATPAGDQSRAN
jgi:hypothetical protein